MDAIADWLKKAHSKTKESMNMRIRVFPRFLAAASEVTPFSANGNREKVIVIGALAFFRAFRRPRVFT